MKILPVSGVNFVLIFRPDIFHINPVCGASTPYPAIYLYPEGSPYIPVVSATCARSIIIMSHKTEEYRESASPRRVPQSGVRRRIKMSSLPQFYGGRPKFTPEENCVRVFTYNIVTKTSERS